MPILVRCKTHLTILALNAIDSILQSQRLNSLYEYASINMKWVFVTSPITNFLVKKLSKLVVPSGLSIAIVMDGNRRYAKSARISRKNGHTLGYHHFYTILDYIKLIECSAAGFFAFAKKNYNRSQEEITDIMDILEKGFEKIENSPDKKQIKDALSIVGDVKSMPKQIVPHVKKINKQTKTKKTCFLFFSYSSLDEYVNTKTDGTVPPFDIIIRPGGEKRFSDFLLCNSATNASVSFVAAKWPLLSPCHIFLILMKYLLERPLEKS